VFSRVEHNLVFFLRDKTKGACRFRDKQLEPPTDIVTAFLVFLIAVNILLIFWRKHYYFYINLIYTFFIYLSLFLWARLSNIDPVMVFKQCLVFILFSGLVAAIPAPNLALQIGYNDRLIPGLNIWLWGVTSYANTLGAAACALFLLEAVGTVSEGVAQKWYFDHYWIGVDYHSVEDFDFSCTRGTFDHCYWTYIDKKSRSIEI